MLKGGPAFQGGGEAGSRLQQRPLPAVRPVLQLAVFCGQSLAAGWPRRPRPMLSRRLGKCGGSTSAICGTPVGDGALLSTSTVSLGDLLDCGMWMIAGYCTGAPFGARRSFGAVLCWPFGSGLPSLG